MAAPPFLQLQRRRSFGTVIHVAGLPASLVDADDYSHSHLGVTHDCSDRPNGGLGAPTGVRACVVTREDTEDPPATLAPPVDRAGGGDAWDRCPHDPWVKGVVIVEVFHLMLPIPSYSPSPLYPSYAAAPLPR